MTTRLLLLPLLLLLCAAGGAAPATFTVPFDIEPAPNGDLYIADGETGKVLRFEARTRKLTVYASFPTPEITSIARVRDGTLYVGEIQTGWIWKVTPKRKKTRFVRVTAPAESSLHGSTLYVASLERGIYAINLRTKRTRIFPMDPGPHGIDVDRNGNVYAARRDIVRFDPRTGAMTVVSPHDAFKPLLAPDGTLYYVNGSPEGAYVDRVEADGTVTRIAGTGKIGADADGLKAADAGLQIADIEWGRDGSLLLAQSDPAPARIRSVDLATGTLSTVLRSPTR